ncbi:MAG: TlpA family protein disulfide reductase [Polyangiaceae bacterium]|nr:TlpA family protein disulfide reductase [Polyangiaceae bacterium]
MSGKNETSKRLPIARIAQIAFAVVAAIGIFSFTTVAKEGESRRRCAATCLLRPDYAGRERPAPNLELQDVAGQTVSLSSYKGKVVVLNFWTRTCAPCMEEVPEIADLTRILQPMNDVAVLTVSTDETAEEAVGAITSILRGEPPFPILMDPEGKTAADKFGTKLFPETWIIDKRGVIVARFDGAREWSNAAVLELINQIRGGGFCDAHTVDGGFVGNDAHICDSIFDG